MADTQFKLPEGAVPLSSLPPEDQAEITEQTKSAPGLPEGAVPMDQFIRDASPQDLFEMAIQTKGSAAPFDPVAYLDKNPDLRKDPSLVAKLADADAYVRERGFKFSDVDLAKSLEGLWHMGKSFVWDRPKNAFQLTKAFVKSKTADTEDEAFEQGLVAAKHGAELLGATELAAFDFIDMFGKAGGKSKELFGSPLKQSPQDRTDAFLRRVDKATQRSKIAQGEGATGEALGFNFADTLKELGHPVDPEAVQNISASDPLVFVAFPGGIKVTSALTGKVLASVAGRTEAVQLVRALRAAETKAVQSAFTAERAARAATALEPTAAALGPLGEQAASAARTTAVEAGEAATKAQQAAQAAAADVATSPGARFVESLPERVNAAGAAAGKVAQTASDVALGTAVGAAGVGLTAAEKLGKTVASFIPPIATPRVLRVGYELAGKAGAKLRSAGKTLITEAPSTYTPGTRLASDAARGALNTAAGAAGGFITLDVPLAAATAERPTETEAMPIFGAAIGAAGGALSGLKRVVTNQRIGRFDAADPRARVSDYRHFSALDEGNKFSLDQSGDERVNNRLAALREYVKPTGAELYFLSGKPDPVSGRSLYEDAIRRYFPGRTEEWYQKAGQTRGVADFAMDDAGKQRKVALFQDIDAAPHEAVHVIETILGERATNELRDQIWTEYAPIWDQVGESYARRFVGPETLRDYYANGETWREAILDATLARRDWRNNVTPEQIEGLSNKYLTSEFLAEVGDAIFKNGGKALENKSWPGRVARILGKTLNGLGIEPFERGTETEGQNIPLRFEATENIRKTLQGGVKEGAVEARRPDITGGGAPPVPPAAPPRPGAPSTPPATPPAATPPPVPSTPPPVPSTPPPAPSARPTAPAPDAAEKARSIAAKADTNPTRGAKSDQELLNTFADSIETGDAVSIDYLSAPGEPAGAVTSNRTARRSIIEAFRSMPADLRSLWEKTFFVDKVEQVGGGKIQIQGWAPEVLAANAHKLGKAIVEGGHTDWWNAEHPTYQLDASTGTFTESGWKNLFNDISAFSQNQRAGLTGAGEPLVVPRSVEARGFKAPEDTGAPGATLDQASADVISALYGVPIPKTPRVGRVFPRNLAGQEVSEATKPGRVSALVEPREPFSGKAARELGIEGRELAEVNPFRAELDQRGIKPDFIEAIQRLNLENVADAAPLPKGAVPEVRAKEFTLQAGFQVGDLADTVKRIREADIPTLRTIVSNTSGKYGGGLTGFAYELGAGLKDPAQLKTLDEARQFHADEARKALKAKDYTAAADNGAKGQLFREAIEFATGTGSAEVGMARSFPDYQPPLKGAKAQPELIGGQFQPARADNLAKEHIKNAAIRLPDGKIHEGMFHGEAYLRAKISPVAENRPVAQQAIEEGFTTSKGRFVGREEAFRIGQAAQQIEKGSKADSTGKFLSLSEDRPALESFSFQESRRFQPAKGKDTENIFYHGTDRTFSKFDINRPVRTGPDNEGDRRGLAVGESRNAVYFTDDPAYAKEFGPKVLAADIKVEKTFDFRNPENQKALQEITGDNDAPVKNGWWNVMERPEVQKYLRDEGYDSYFATDTSTGKGGAPVPRATPVLAVLNPERIGEARETRFQPPKEDEKPKAPDWFKPSESKEIIREIPNATASKEMETYEPSWILPDGRQYVVETGAIYHDDWVKGFTHFKDSNEFQGGAGAVRLATFDSARALGDYGHGGLGISFTRPLSESQLSKIRQYLESESGFGEGEQTFGNFYIDVTAPDGTVVAALSVPNVGKMSVGRVLRFLRDPFSGKEPDAIYSSEKGATFVRDPQDQSITAESPARAQKRQEAISALSADREFPNGWKLDNTNGAEADLISPRGNEVRLKTFKLTKKSYEVPSAKSFEENRAGQWVDVKVPLEVEEAYLRQLNPEMEMKPVLAGELRDRYGSMYIREPLLDRDTARTKLLQDKPAQLRQALTEEFGENWQWNNEVPPERIAEARSAQEIKDFNITRKEAQEENYNKALRAAWNDKMVAGMNEGTAEGTARARAAAKKQIELGATVTDLPLMFSDLEGGSKFQPRLKDKTFEQELSKIREGKSDGQTFTVDGKVFVPKEPTDVVSVASINTTRDKLSAADVREAVSKFDNVLDAPGVSIGIFPFDKSAKATTSIDINAMVPQKYRENTLKFARDNDQVAIFDLEKFETIPTGGEGKTVITDPAKIAAAVEKLTQGEPVEVKNAGEAMQQFQVAKRKAGKKLPNAAGDEDFAIVHYSSKPGLEQVDPTFFGKGKATPSDLRGGEKSYFFVKGSDLGQDANLFGAGGLVTYDAKVPGSRLYDLRAGKEDPLGWRKTINREEADSNVKKEGYAGIITDTRDGRTVVAMFEPVPVTERAEASAPDRQIAFQPKAEEALALPGFTEAKKVPTKNEIANMTRKQLKEVFPEAVIPKSMSDTMSSETTESPLYKEAGSEPKAVEAFAKRLVKFAKDSEGTPEYELGRKWYSEFTPMLKRAFGKDAEIFAELLAATSPQTAVGVNFQYAFDALKSWQQGRFKKIIPKFEEGLEKMADGSWESWYNKQVKAGKVANAPENPSPASFLAHWIETHNLKPTQTNGKLYGQHSTRVLQVFARKWMEMNAGPKTRNFVGNLLGTVDEATIDLWSDRTMRWAGYEGKADRWRILPQNSQAVRDVDFAFSQKAFRAAADQLGIKPSELQAALWFAEKKRWADNGWSGAADLGDFRTEMEKIPAMQQKFESRLRESKRKSPAQLGFDIEPRYK